MARYGTVVGGLCLMVTLGCGGGESKSITNPNSNPGSPVSLSVAAGDGQTGDPGATLAVRPAVIARDASSHAVPNVTVTFAVDSGGGHLSATTVTTDATGIATAGDWSLGPNEGVNVVSATVARTGASPLVARFHASGLRTGLVLSDTVLSATGGTISYAKPNDPLSGFALTVPPRAYASSQSWRITTNPSLRVPLPDGLAQIGGGITIGTDQGYADSVLVIRIPARVGLDTALAVFYYDPGAQYLEVVPMLARDSISVTAGVRHVRSAYLWKPRVPGSTARLTANATSSFDQVTFITVALPIARLNAPVTTGFMPGVDDWEFTNWGSEISTGGICAGMSISAMYYYDRIKPQTGRGLFHQYDVVPNFDWDNPQGIRFASMIQHIHFTGFWGAMKQQMITLAQQSQLTLGQLSYQSLIIAMLTTSRPQLFSMDQGTLGSFAHAVVAYAASGGVVKLADPNQPGAPGVTATFANNAFDPILLQVVAGTPPDLFTRVFVFGTSNQIPTSSIDDEWQRFTSGIAGDGTFTPLNFEWSDDPTAPVYQLLGDSVSVWGNYVGLGDRCPVCTPTHTLGLLNDIHGADVASPLRPTGPMRDSIGVRVEVNGGFTNFRWTLVKARVMDVTPQTGNFLVLRPVTFMARPYGQAPAGARYVWDFGDGTLKVTVVGDSLVTHTFTQTFIGHYVAVELQDANGTKLTRAYAAVSVRNHLRVDVLAGVIDSTYQWVARGLDGDDPFTVEWNFGDHTPLVVRPDTFATHRYSRPSAYVVKAVAIDHMGLRFDSTTASARIYPGEWRLTSITLLATAPPKVFEIPRRLAAWDSLKTYLQQVEQTPRDGMIFLADDSLWTEHGAYFQVAPPGTGASLVYWGAGSTIILVARPSTVQFSNFSFTGTLWSGTLTGTGYTTLFNHGAGTGGEFLNTVSATKSGNTMSGTLMFTLYDGSSNPAMRSYSFTARLVP